MVQANRTPHKMMEGMRLRFVHCDARSTPPHFVMNVRKIIVQSILTDTPVGTKLFIGHDTCHMCLWWTALSVDCL